MSAMGRWLWLLLLVPLLLTDCQPGTSQESLPQETPWQDQGGAEQPLPDRVTPDQGPVRDVPPSLETPIPDKTSDATPDTPVADATPEQPAAETTPDSPASSLSPVGLTYHRRDGNRLVSGRGALLQTQPLDISLSGEPMWLVALPAQQGSVWFAVLTDGRVEAFQISGRTVQKLAPTLARLPAKMPPVLVIGPQGPSLVTPPPKASKLTHPVPLAGGKLAFIEESGDLVLWSGGKESGRLRPKALLDARLLVDEQERILLLTDPTTRYAHGVLGDATEAASITLVATKPKLQVLQKIAIPGQRVVEGIAPIWTDLTGDGKREIIVTLSDANQGAQLVVYDEGGKVLATSPAIGAGNRWRNQLVVAPFGAGGALELVDVFTPHIGGPTEFFRFQQGALQRVAQASGYTAHVYGSRNLDLGLAGDLNGDGRTELLLPTQDLTNLGVIQRDANTTKTLKMLPLGGRLSTNLAAVGGPTQPLLVGAGTSGQLRIWGAK